MKVPHTPLLLRLGGMRERVVVVRRSKVRLHLKQLPQLAGDKQRVVLQHVGCHLRQERGNFRGRRALGLARHGLGRRCGLCSSRRRRKRLCRRRRRRRRRCFACRRCVRIMGAGGGRGPVSVSAGQAIGRGGAPLVAVDTAQRLNDSRGHAGDGIAAWLQRRQRNGVSQLLPPQQTGNIGRLVLRLRWQRQTNGCKA